MGKSYDKFIYVKYMWDPDKANVNKLSVNQRLCHHVNAARMQ